jgi:hypothetical protein
MSQPEEPAPAFGYTAQPGERLGMSKAREDAEAFAPRSAIEELKRLHGITNPDMLGPEYALFTQEERAEILLEIFKETASSK